MRYKIKLRLNDDGVRVVKHVEAATFTIDAGALIFYTNAMPSFAVGAGEWYQVREVPSAA